jgi:hypothetical protein
MVVSVLFESIWNWSLFRSSVDVGGCCVASLSDSSDHSVVIVLGTVRGTVVVLTFNEC